jgi:hypothetical protein
VSLGPGRAVPHTGRAMPQRRPALASRRTKPDHIAGSMRGRVRPAAQQPAGSTAPAGPPTSAVCDDRRSASARLGSAGVARRAGQASFRGASIAWGASQVWSHRASGLALAELEADGGTGTSGDPSTQSPSACGERARSSMSPTAQRPHGTNRIPDPAMEEPGSCLPLAPGPRREDGAHVSTSGCHLATR